MEEWKAIKSTDGKYEVSNEGRVRRVYQDKRTAIRNNSEYRYLKSVRHAGHGTDYLTVSLPIENGKRQHFLIHRLVAEAFLPNPDNLPQVDHINSKGTDNRVENLEWVSNRENALRAKRNGLTRPFREGIAVKCVELDKVFGSSFEAADFINNTKYHDSHRIKALASNIRACAKGLRPKAYGYRWKLLK